MAVALADPRWLAPPSTAAVHAALCAEGAGAAGHAAPHLSGGHSGSPGARGLHLERHHDVMTPPCDSLRGRRQMLTSLCQFPGSTRPPSSLAAMAVNKVVNVNCSLSNSAQKHLSSLNSRKLHMHAACALSSTMAALLCSSSHASRRRPRPIHTARHRPAPLLITYA